MTDTNKRSSLLDCEINYVWKKVFEEKARLREGLSLVGSVVWSTPGRPTDLPDIEGLSLAVEAAEVRRHVHRGRVKELVPVDVQHPLQLVLYSSSSACV